MELLRLSRRVIELHRELLDKGSVMVLSDVGTGAALCGAALRGAALNVRVNTRLMRDRAYAEAMDLEVDRLVEENWDVAETVFEDVLGRYC